MYSAEAVYTVTAVYTVPAVCIQINNAAAECMAATDKNGHKSIRKVQTLDPPQLNMKFHDQARSHT